MSSSRAGGLTGKNWVFLLWEKDSSLPLGRIIFATQCTSSVFGGLYNYNHSTLAENSPGAVGGGGGLSDQSPNWVQISGQSWIKLRKPHSLLQTITIISFYMWTENIFLQQKEELNGWPWNGHRVWKQKKEMVFSSDVGGYECEQAKRGDVWVFYYCITNCHKFSSLKQHVLISS